MLQIYLIGLVTETSTNTKENDSNAVETLAVFQYHV